MLSMNESMQDPLLPPDVALLEESLVREAAEMPLLSAGFRSRALGAAIEARRQRSFGRRTACVGGLLVVVLGLAAWRVPLAIVGGDLLEFSTTAAADARTEPVGPGLDVSLRYGRGRGQLLMFVEGDDWKMVDAEVLSRQEGSRRIGAAD